MIELLGMSSPNVRKVGLMLEELGLDYRMRYVSVFRGGQHEPDFLALNPFAKVPVLLDDRNGGRPIAESGAILIYLAETYGRFLPTSGPARFETLQWLMFQMAAIGPMFGQNNHFMLLGDQADAYAAARYRTQSERLYRLLDQRLASETWVAGGAYSIADIAIYPWANYLEQHGFDPAAHPALVRWRDVIAARPAAIAMKARFAEEFAEPDRLGREGATAEQLDQFFWRDPASPHVDFSGINGR